jgi:hypothetical protein
MANKDKLLKLADFLTSLKTEEFDYSIIVEEFDRDKRCGTVCCAVGWLPAVFPEEAVWDGGYSITTPTQNLLAFETAEHILDITQTEAEGLFEPNDQERLRDQFKVGEDVFPDLGDDATPIEVADMIRKFVELSCK